mmetsp:Transcript_3584/g.7869  ORF Transcript_3584/g.7869 Transcript_3584/m.7869 type:complete len:145 (+) Transcript_3584:95-529(+)
MAVYRAPQRFASQLLATARCQHFDWLPAIAVQQTFHNVPCRSAETLRITLPTVSASVPGASASWAPLIVPALEASQARDRTLCVSGDMSVGESMSSLPTEVSLPGTASSENPMQALHNGKALRKWKWRRKMFAGKNKRHRMKHG